MEAPRREGPKVVSEPERADVAPTAAMAQMSGTVAARAEPKASSRITPAISRPMISPMPTSGFWRREAARRRAPTVMPPSP